MRYKKWKPKHTLATRIISAHSFYGIVKSSLATPTLPVRLQQTAGPTQTGEMLKWHAWAKSIDPGTPSGSEGSWRIAFSLKQKNKAENNTTQLPQNRTHPTAVHRNYADEILVLLLAEGDSLYKHPPYNLGRCIAYFKKLTVFANSREEYEVWLSHISILDDIKEKRCRAVFKCISHYYSQRALAADRGRECCEKKHMVWIMASAFRRWNLFWTSSSVPWKAMFRGSSEKTTRRSQWGALMAICNTHHYSMDQTGCLATHRLPSNKRWHWSNLILVCEGLLLWGGD